MNSVVLDGLVRTRTLEVRTPQRLLESRFQYRREYGKIHREAHWKVQRKVHWKGHRKIHWKPIDNPSTIPVRRQRVPTVEIMLQRLRNPGSGCDKEYPKNTCLRRPWSIADLNLFVFNAFIDIRLSAHLSAYLFVPLSVHLSIFCLTF